MGRFVGTRRALFTLLNGLFLNGGRLTSATTFASPVALSAGANTLSVKPPNTTTTYTLAGAVSGSGPLTVNANVTLTAAATYTGATTITVGRTFTLTNNYATVAFAVPVGATLVFAPTIANQVGNSNATLSGAGTVLKSGANMWNPCGGSRTFAFAMTGGLIDVQGGKITASSGFNANWTSNLSSLNVASGAIFSGVEASIRVDALTGAGSVTLGYQTSGGLVLGVNNTVAGVYNSAGTATFSGVISPEGGVTTGSTLTKNGTGTQILTGNNTYVGTTAVNAGTLTFGDGGLTGNIGTGAVSIAAGANLSIRRSNNGLSIPNNFSGAGDLNFIGTGTLDQSSYNVTGNSSTFTGTIRLTTARIQVSVATQVGATCPIVVTSGGQLHQSAAITLNNPISIAGNGWVEGAGVIGAIRLTNGAIYAGSITLTAAARIATYASTGTISGAITGAFNLELASYGGAGTITLTGNSSTLTSISTVSPLVVELTGASTNFTVASGATLGGGSAITGNVKALTFSAAGSILRVRPLSTTSLSLVTATSLVNASGFTVAYIAGFTVTAGVYNILRITSTAAPTLGTITSSGLANIGRTGATYAITGSAGAWNLAVTLT